VAVKTCIETDVSKIYFTGNPLKRKQKSLPSKGGFKFSENSLPLKEGLGMDVT
tara:strand:- start:348 stop:506 length:159 start_codon:yes stop_codon:yes gene_type:complete